MNEKNEIFLTRMNLSVIVFLTLSMYFSQSGMCQSISKFRVVWDEVLDEIEGEVKIQEGILKSINVSGRRSSDEHFKINTEQKPEAVFEVSDFNVGYGPHPTRITIHTNHHSFTFLLRDLSQEWPIYIPEYKVAVLMQEDDRTYPEVEKEILNRKLFTKIEQIEREPEISFESVADKNKKMNVPIWLGIGRDMRMFDISEELQDFSQEGKIIRPKYATSGVKLQETNNNAAYLYALGRGVGVENNITRYLDKGSLPIYHSVLKDDDVVYHSISFVSFANLPLTEETNTGTNYIVSDKHSSGRVFKEEHMEEMETKMKTAYDFEDDMVLYCRTEIENTGSVPRYAWIKTPRPGTGWWYKKIHNYDSESGFSSYDLGGGIFCISMINGVPMQNEEMAVLIYPGEKIDYEFFMPHTPVSIEKAQKLTKQSFNNRLEEARKYWDNKLSSTGRVELPEKRIDDMVKAGLLHLNLITFGEEPEGILSANIGVYSPIGTESSPIIQFYLSMGWFDVAKRAINYFLETQLESGYIQNYGGYTVETGAALWTMGEYVRYTGDTEWLTQWKEKILKSCNYLIQWREKNKKEEYTGRGYGMIDGQVADPVDPYHQFMLNGYAYLGLSRIGEVLEKVDQKESARLKREAAEWKEDIIKTTENLFGLSPVVPLGDGTWVPTLPPWAESDGPRALFLNKETYWSHGTFTGADAMLGPIYLVFCEIFNPESKETERILKYQSELFYQGNSAFSQPYYSRHNWLQARLGMVKPFLNTYYNTMAAHADRETYTFWEHMYRVSPHKTHEEAWFLMETRWMLYMEIGDTLSLFRTIPRKWMEEGKSIELDGVRSYFGKLKVEVTSHVEHGFIEARVGGDFQQMPKEITIRLPHPEGKYPVKVIGGIYDKENETVTVQNPAKNNLVRIEF